MMELYVIIVYTMIAQAAQKQCMGKNYLSSKLHMSVKLTLALRHYKNQKRLMLKIETILRKFNVESTISDKILWEF